MSLASCWLAQAEGALGLLIHAIHVMSHAAMHVTQPCMSNSFTQVQGHGDLIMYHAYDSMYLLLFRMNLHCQPEKLNLAALCMPPLQDLEHLQGFEKECVHPGRRKPAVKRKQYRTVLTSVL